MRFSGDLTTDESKAYEKLRVVAFLKLKSEKINFTINPTCYLSRGKAINQLRGKPSARIYSSWDEMIRDINEFLKTHTDKKVYLFMNSAVDLGVVPYHILNDLKYVENPKRVIINTCNAQICLVDLMKSIEHMIFAKPNGNNCQSFLNEIKEGKDAILRSIEMKSRKNVTKLYLSRIIQEEKEVEEENEGEENEGEEENDEDVSGQEITNNYLNIYLDRNHQDTLESLLEKANEHLLSYLN